MKFLPTFLFQNIEVYDPLIRNFRAWASDKRAIIFFLLRSWQIRVYNVRHSANGENMQISTVDVKKCVKPSSHHAAERYKRGSGKFFVTGGPVLVSCKTPLTRKALPYLYFRKTKSEERNVSDLFGDTGPAAKRRMDPCYAPSISNKVAIVAL